MISSSSIVMILFSGLGVVSVMRLLLLLAWLRLATSKSARFGSVSPTQLYETSVRHHIVTGHERTSCALAREIAEAHLQLALSLLGRGQVAIDRARYLFENRASDDVLPVHGKNYDGREQHD